MKGTKTATGDAVESMIQASLARDILSLSVMGLNKGPTIRGVPESVKNNSEPLIHAPIWALVYPVIYLIIIPAKAAAPPDFSIRPTRPAMKIIKSNIPMCDLVAASATR